VSAAIVAVDRFPVDVVTDDGLLRQVKLILTQPQGGVGRLKVWSAPDVLALDTDFDLEASDIRSKQVDWSIQTEAGVVTVRSSRGCGCGNRLKYWQPPEFSPLKMGRLR
jgi:hypothetical protein